MAHDVFQNVESILVAIRSGKLENAKVHICN
jgi:hypothetical protein